MKLSLRKMDALYFSDICHQRADSLEWLRKQMRADNTLSVYAAIEIIAEAERVFRAISTASAEYADAPRGELEGVGE